jgi:hypothetical protein
MYSKLVFLVLLLILIVPRNLLADSSLGYYDATATAYLKDGRIIHGYYFIGLQTMWDYDQKNYPQEIGDEDEVYFHKGENILDFFKPAYEFFKYDSLDFATEITENKYGTFIISESVSKIKLSEIDSLIFIDNKLGSGYGASTEINRRDADILQNVIISDYIAYGSGIDVVIANTNPHISWQEMYLYSSQNYLDSPNDRVSWNKDNPYDYLSQKERITQMYKLQGKQVLPEMIKLARDAAAALESVIPYVESLTLFEDSDIQEIKESLVTPTQKSKDLYYVLLDYQSGKLTKDFDRIVSDEHYYYYFFDAVFPKIPVIYYENYKMNWNEYLNPKGVVSFGIPWD